ncbi:MAG: hypothetical protein UU66_C0035G0002 [Parcubacteria group bacterium GW2011_GWB1_41_5]|nr:MAG: hypothetical protein UU66_C0035G0002 [Parcubacteria group bacterium GW2011_GWB1_41_5]
MVNTTSPTKGPYCLGNAQAIRIPARPPPHNIAIMFILASNYILSKNQIKFTSGRSPKPNFSFTAVIILLAKFNTSSPVAPPKFTKTRACLSCTPTFPILLPFHPHCSINQPAGTLITPSPLEGEGWGEIPFSSQKKGISGYFFFNFSNSAGLTKTFLKKLPAFGIIIGSGSLLFLIRETLCF